VLGLHRHETRRAARLSRRRTRNSSQIAADYALTQSAWEQPDAPSRVQQDNSEEALARVVNEIVDTVGLDGTQKVLEVGCGDGRISQRLLPYVAELSAFDASTRLVAMAEGRLAGCKVWQQSFLDPMPLGFDVVVSFQCRGPPSAVSQVPSKRPTWRPGGTYGDT
jgi:2-polyprenyl-3-methyl-5-hydroxy-6-metoxy-1,4-benzoquinol methylase